MELNRKCPRCNKDINYKRKGDLQQANKHNTKCKKCVIDTRILGLNPKQYIRQCPNCKKDMLYCGIKARNRAENLKKWCKQCLGVLKTGKQNLKLSETFNIKYKNQRIKKECKTCNSIFYVTKWNKEKIYCSLICYNNDSNVQKREKYQPSYNKKACVYFDKLNEIKKWNGVHALNGGEKKVKRYWVDYYEPNLNIVIEWDEKFHQHIKDNDLKRQQEIIEYLKCDFYRINEDTFEVVKINKNGKVKKQKKDDWYIPFDI